MSSAPEQPTQRRGLGRGLEVLVGGGGGEPELLHVPVDAIHPNPRQPRRRFEPEATTGLADSLRHQGVLQPVVVRPRSAGGYELVAGLAPPMSCGSRLVAKVAERLGRRCGSREGQLGADLG